MTDSSETTQGNDEPTAEQKTEQKHQHSSSPASETATQNNDHTQLWDSAMQDATVAATGAPNTNLAQNPATGHTHVRRPAPVRGTSDVPPAARRNGEQYYPNLPAESRWGSVHGSAKSQADDSKVELLDQAFENQKPIWDKVEQLFAVAVRGSDYTLLNTAANISSDIDLSAALSYAAAVCAWKAHADDLVPHNAQIALLARPALHPLITSHAPSLMVRRDVNTVPLRLPVSDATMQVLAAWPDQPSALPELKRLSNTLLLLCVHISANAGDEETTERVMKQLQDNITGSAEPRTLAWADLLRHGPA